MQKFKYFLITILSFVLFFCASQKLNAQSINITVSLLPPYSPYFSDYLVYENKTTIICNGINATNKRFYFKGSVKGDNGIIISTKNAYKPAQPLVLNGNNLIIKGIDIQEYFNWENVNVIGIDLPKVAQGDGLPEGNYTICLQAFDFDTDVALSAAAPSGCVSIDIRNIEPPKINLPQCGAALNTSTSQNIVFSWTPPPGAPINTRYLLKMAEMPFGFTNYNDALNTLTTPSFFEKQTITITYVYTLADAPLQAGRTYAYKIVAYDPNNKINFRNNGESEVCYFTYGNIDVVKEDTKPPTKTTKKSTKKISNYTGNIPTNTIKGKLTWAFFKTEEKDEATNIDNKIPVEKSKDAKPAFGEFVTTMLASDASYAAATKASQVSGSGGVVAPATGNPKLNGYAYIPAAATGVSYAANPISAVLMTEQNRQEGKISSLAGSKQFALKNTIVRIYLNTRLYSETKSGGIEGSTSSSSSSSTNSTPKNTSASKNISSVFASGAVSAASATYTNAANKAPAKEQYDALGRVLLGTTTTDENGEFSLASISESLWKSAKPILSIEFDHPNFIYATRFIENVKAANGVIDLGEHLGLAKTYRIRVKVKEPFVDAAHPGNTIDDAVVKILRQKNVQSGTEFYEKEVNGFTNKTTTENDFEVVGSGKAGTLFNRLFYATQGYNDKYFIEVTKNGYTSQKEITQHFPNKNEGIDEQVSEYVSGYSIKEATTTVSIKAPTYIKGILVAKGNDIPLSGKKITLFNKTTNKDEGTPVVTDAEGKFSIDNIAPNSGIIYGLKISMDGNEVFPNKADGNVQDPQNIVIASYGDTKEFNNPPLRIGAELVTLNGFVKDAEGATQSNVVLKWKDGGTSFTSGNNGEFIATNSAGKHILILSKNGFKNTEVEIDVQNTNTSSSNNKSSKNNKTTSAATTTPISASTWMNGIMSTASAVTATNKSKNTAASQAAASGVQLATNMGYTSLSSMYSDYFGTSASLNTGKVQDVGTIIIKRFFVKVTVTDAANNSAITNAKVQVKDAEISTYTNASGVAIINNAKGSAPSIIVSGPDGAAYITKEIVFDLKADKDTAIVEAKLEKGIVAKGKVLLAGAGVTDAIIFVEGKEFIKATSNGSGDYSIALPSGEYTLIASKTGLQGDKKTLNITTTVTQDFVMKDPGFNASKILGFDIELYESKAGASATEKIISGAFIKIPSNGLFELPASFKLPFNNIKINITGGMAVPVGDSVVTTVSEIPLELFNYLTLKLKSTKGITIKKADTDPNLGRIVGSVALDINAIINKVVGIKIPADLEIGLTGSGANKKEITAFMSNGAIPLDGNNLKLLGLNDNSGNWSFSGVDIKVDFNKSFVLKDGLQLAGNVKLNGFPVIGDKNFIINQFKINTGGDVFFDVACNLNEEIDFSVWKMNLGMLKISNYGVNIGGKMIVDIPETDKISVAFSNLGIGKGGLSGGTFNLYSQKIAEALNTVEKAAAQAQDAYNNAVAKAKEAANNAVEQATKEVKDAANKALNDAKAAVQTKLDDLLTSVENKIPLFKIISYEPTKGGDFSLTKVVGSNDYKLQGGGIFALKEYIDKKIKLNYFAIATDGKFAFDVPLNTKQDFFGGIAELELTRFGFNAFEKTFTVGGGLFLKIPGIGGIGAATEIVYYQNKPAVLKDIKLKLDIASVGTFEAGIGLTNSGFKGTGVFKVLKSFNIGGTFIYEKLDGGFHFGVGFELPVAPIIPVGIINIGVTGGGFDINSAKSSVAVEVKGFLSLVADPVGGFGVKPLTIKLTVGADGPILEGEGTMQTAKFPLGKCGFKIDYPNKYFTAYAEGGPEIKLIPSLPIKVNFGCRVSVNAKSGNEYVMLGAFQEVNILNLAKANSNIIFGWGLPKNQGTEEDKYVAFIPDNYLYNNKIFGFGLSVKSQIGIAAPGVGFNIKIVAAKAWFRNETDLFAYGRFKGGELFGFGMEQNYTMGGELSAMGISLLGLAVNVNGHVDGGFGNGDWYFDASLNAGIKVALGANCDGACDTKICYKYSVIPTGIQVCASGKANLNYNNKTGLKVGLSLQ